MRSAIVTILTLLGAALAGCGEAPPARNSAETVAGEAPVMGPQRTVLAFGDSLFAGYNLEEDEGYPETLESALRARGINAQVVDAGVSGDTSAAGRQRLAFTLNSLDAAPDLAIVELGGNDLLRGVDPAETRANLSAIVEALKARDIPVLLMGMRAPPNLGPDYTGRFDAIYREIAEQHDVALVPFLLEPIYRRPELIQADRIHPTAEGIEEMVAYTIDDVAAELDQAN